MPGPLRIAIVGVGWAGSRQIAALDELGGAAAVACLVDNDADFLRRKAAEFGVDTTYATLDEALADPTIEAVSICLPHDLHEGAAVAAARAGKQILCEKPLAPTVAGANRILAAADAAGVKVYVAENAVYQPLAHFLRDYLARGALGALIYASVAAGFRAPDFGYPDRRAWLTEPSRGGTGTWMLHGVHTVAQLRAILGEVATVYLREHHAPSFERADIEGTMSGLLTLASGLPVALLQSSETPLPADFAGYILHGERGTLRAGRDGATLYRPGATPLDIAIQPIRSRTTPRRSRPSSTTSAATSSGRRPARASGAASPWCRRGTSRRRTGDPWTCANDSGRCNALTRCVRAPPLSLPSLEKGQGIACSRSAVFRRNPPHRTTFLPGKACQYGTLPPLLIVPDRCYHPFPDGGNAAWLPPE